MKTKFVKILFIVVLVNTAVFAQTKMSDAKLSREMVGIWQVSENVAAGMNDLYRFFSNGNFVFEYNQMVWSKRNISYSGKWKIKNRKLILMITSETVVVGGRKVKSDMSADGFEIQGRRELMRKLKTAKTEIKDLGKLQQGELTKFITIGKTKYWRLSKNPKDYKD